MYRVYFIYQVGKVLISDEQDFKTEIEAKEFALCMVKQHLGKAQIVKLKGASK